LQAMAEAAAKVALVAATAVAASRAVLEVGVEARVVAAVAAATEVAEVAVAMEVSRDLHTSSPDRAPTDAWGSSIGILTFGYWPYSNSSRACSFRLDLPRLSCP